MAGRKPIIMTASEIIDTGDFIPDNENYEICLRGVMEWLRTEWSGDNGTRKAKAEVIVWLTNEKRLDDAAAIAEVESWRFHHIGKYYYAMNYGGILENEAMVWLEEKLAPFLVMGRDEIIRKEEANIVAAKSNIKPRSSKAVETLSGNALAFDLEDLILTGEFGNEMNSAFEVLKTHSPKPGVLRIAVAKVQSFVDELNSFTDSEIDEGFPNVDAYKEAKIAYGELLRVTSTFTQNAKTLRKATRKKKTNRYSKDGKALMDVAKVQVMAEFPELNIVSIPLEKIVGARAVMVYNTKERKLGIFRATDNLGLQVKGTTIKNFDEELSGQKKLRKPDVQIEYVRSVTLKRAEIVLRDNINSKMATITGRLNSNVVIMAAWK